MKRPMCTLAVSWLVGLFLASREPMIEIKYFLVIYFFLIILGLMPLKKYPQMITSKVQKEWYPQFTMLILLIPCLFLGGYLRMSQYLTVQKEQELPWKMLEEKGEAYVTLEGTVKEKHCEEKVVLELTDCAIISYYGQENQIAGACRVNVDDEGKEWLPETFIGNKIRVFGKFSTYSQASNPGQFDAHAYYTGQGLFADVSALRINVLEDRKSPIGHALFQLKQRMRESINSLYPPEKAGVLVAMILGDKDLLSEEVEDLYRQNGISHILAISGLHISMLCMGLFGALRKLTVPPKAAAFVAVGFLLFYVSFTGAGTSSLRAGTMCLVMFGAILLRRGYDLLSSLALAAILVTCVRPGEIYSAGFLLSFGAVFGVALAQEMEYAIIQMHDGKRPWWSVFVFGGMIQCITLPVSLWFFYELSPYGIILNLVVIPLVSLILGGGIVSAVLGMFRPVAAKLPVGGTYLLLDFYEWLCEKAQKLPFSFVLLGRPEAWQLIAYYVVLALVLTLFFVKARQISQDAEGVSGKEKWREAVKRWELVSVVGICLCVGSLFLPGKQNAELLFLDVSQGDGALFTTENGMVILSDCGSSDVSKVGEYRLSPVLKQSGILLVDMAVVSHLDSDHTSGIKELLENMPVYDGQLRFASQYGGAVGVKELVLPKVQEKSEAYLELESLALTKNVSVRYMQGGEPLYQKEDLLIECLYPINAKESENDTSLVLLLQTPELVAWLMGDAGIAPEAELMERLAAVNMEALREDKLVLLKVGHHGSKTSSGEAFVRFVQPDIAVISCGYRNSYGHPHASVLERLESVGATVFRTDLQGAIVVETGRFDEPEVNVWRKKAQK